jgi:hypothetical protein
MNDNEKRGPWGIVSRRTSYDNRWMKVTHHELITTAGETGIYGTVHYKNLAIGIVPVDDEVYTFLIGQHRFPLDEYSWEIPEGGGLPPAAIPFRESQSGLVAPLSIGRLDRRVLAVPKGAVLATETKATRITKIWNICYNAIRLLPVSRRDCTSARHLAIAEPYQWRRSASNPFPARGWAWDIPRHYLPQGRQRDLLGKRNSSSIYPLRIVIELRIGRVIRSAISANSRTVYVLSS